MHNYWLNLIAKRHLKQDLEIRFLGQNYLQIVANLSQFAFEHSYWNKIFEVHVAVNNKQEIEKIEIRENPCTY